MLRGVGLTLCVLALVGCDGGHKAATCSPKVLQALMRLDHDVGAIRNAASNAAVNHATDRFLNDAFTEPIDNLTRNRMIDHAAATLAGRCPQCFQALEANRPDHHHPLREGLAYGSVRIRTVVLTRGRGMSGSSTQKSAGSV